jgi:predicted dehydrogenase
VDRAPDCGAVHDFRDNFNPDAIVEPDEHTVWRPVDADLAYTVMVELAMPAGGVANGLFRASAMANCRYDDYLAFYGERGTLHLSGPNAPDRIEHYDRTTRQWQALAVPPEILAQLPQVEEPVQRDWNQFYREFVADIHGAGYSGYPTFYEGMLHNDVFDAVRSGNGWSTNSPAAVHA